MRPSPTSERRDRGAVIPLVAIVMPVLLIMTAFAVDLGMQRAARRTSQARADVIALDLARLIDGTGVPTASQTADAKAESGRRNNMDPDKIADLTVRWGTLAAADNSFVQCSSCIATAVEVTAVDEVDYFFRPGGGSVSRSAVAVAQGNEGAYFQVGSYLLAVNPASNSAIGGLLNTVIPGASVLSYNGLVGADVTLAGLEAGLHAITPTTGLDTMISYRDLILAEITALQAEGGNTAAIAVLNNLLATAATVDQFTLGDLVRADLSGGTPGGTAEFDVLGLLTGAVLLSDGQHAISVPGTSIGTGFGTIDVAADVIERPQIGGPELLDTASTGQLHLTVNPHLTVTTAPTQLRVCTLDNAVKTALQNLIGGLLGLVGCVLNPLLEKTLVLSVTVDAPISVRAAGADVTLTDIDCDATKGIQLTPSPVPLSVDAPVSITVTGTLAGGSLGTLARIDIPAHVNSVGSASAQYFQYPSQFGPPARGTGSNPLGFANLLNTAPASVTLLNVPLGPIVNPLLVPLTTALNTSLGLLDTTLIQPISQMLGISLGGADLTALSLECGEGQPLLVG